MTLIGQGRRAESFEQLERAGTLAREAASHDELFNVGAVYGAGERDPRSAEKWIRTAIATLRATEAASEANEWEARRTLAYYLLNLQGPLRCQKKYEAAQAVINEAQAVLESVIAHSPSDPSAFCYLASSYWDQAMLDLAQNEHRNAERALRESISLWEESVSRALMPVDIHYGLSGEPYRALVNLLDAGGRTNEAVLTAREHLQHWVRVTEAFPRSGVWRYLTDKSEQVIGFYEARGFYDEALAMRCEVLDALEATEDPHAWNHAAWELTNSRKVGMRNPQRAIALARRAVMESPRGGHFLTTLGAAYYRAGLCVQGRESLEESLAIGTPHVARTALFLAMANWKLENRYDARHWLKKAVDELEQSGRPHDDLLRFRKEAEELIGRTALLPEGDHQGLASGAPPEPPP
jgi:tetratricopeptide (TPR) repeat protein